VLMFAAARNHLDVVQALLKAKADVNIKTNKGATALTVAAVHGCPEIVKALYDSGADVNTKFDMNMTALMWASEAGKLDVVRVLLDAKADVNAQTNRGSTALIMASSNGHPEVVRLLLAKGADVNTCMSNGRCALDTATARGNADVVQLLKGAGAISMEEAFAAVDRIVILPVIDARPNENAKTNLEGLRKHAQKILEGKHYVVEMADSPPAGVRWVMVLSFKSLDNISPGVPAASVDGILCDMEGTDNLPICGGHGSKLWSGTGTGQFNPLQPTQASMNDVTATILTNLTWQAFGLAKKDAVSNAIFNLLNDIPKQPKKKNK